MIANARRVGVGLGCALLLGFTLPPAARADDAQRIDRLGRDGLPLWSDDPSLLPPTGDGQRMGSAPGETSASDTDAYEVDSATRARWVDNPYAPHDTTGANVRAGSAVGRVVHDHQPYTALGVTIAGGPRMGRFTLEGHYTYVGLSAPGPSDERFGSAHRLGVMARADLFRLDSRVVGANSMLAFYAEAGLVEQYHRWQHPAMDERPRVVPVDGRRGGAIVGFGFNLDFRLEQPLGFPNRVGWQLGWQLTASDEHAPDPTVICRGVSCLAQPVGGRTPARDTSMLVTSTIAFTW